MTDLRKQLRKCLVERVCFLALGNVDYGDDGLGVRLGERLVAAGMPNVIIA
jgi:Ni,Fe-hydrogenase maturation factor